MIALVTDSNAMLPAPLRARFHVRVVPLTLVVDGEAYAEGVDITTVAFNERLAAGATVSTAAPPPGAFVAAYDAAAADGADVVLSVHIGSNTSATIDSARIAARQSAVPVELVDTGTASFPVGCCVWAAGSVLEAGGPLEAAAGAARQAAKRVDNIFVVGALDLAIRSGRLREDAAREVEEGVSVFALRGGAMEFVAQAHDVEAAVDAMAVVVEQAAAHRRLLVGVGDAAAPELAGALAARLGGHPSLDALVRYEVGPSVTAHTGLGTAGAVYFPAEVTTG